MSVVVTTMSLEERNVKNFTKTLGKYISTRETKISTLNEKIVSLNEKHKIWQTKINTLYDLYDVIHTFTKKQIVYDPLMSELLQFNSIKLSQLSDNGMKWQFWNFDKCELDSKIDELVFIEPVKSQLLNQIRLHEKYCFKSIQMEIEKTNRKLRDLDSEIKKKTDEITYKIKYENAFVYRQLETVFTHIFKHFGYITMHMWSSIQQSRYITMTQLNECIHILKIFNEPRLQSVLNTFIYSKPKINQEIIKPNNFKMVYTGTYKRMNKMSAVLRNVEKIVNFLNVKSPNSVNPLYYKQFNQEYTKFKNLHKNLWVKFYIQSIPFIKNTPRFSDILVNSIYEYLF